MRTQPLAEGTMPAAVVLDGKAIAERIKQALQKDLAALTRKPTLAILYFQTPASTVYQAAQCAQAKALGIRTVDTAFPMEAKQTDVERMIQRWNDDPSVHGIFVHQPMPPQVDPQRVSAAIDQRKDIEGIHPQNSARRFFA